MLTISDIVENLPAHIVTACEQYHSIQIQKVVAGDLMSDVLVSVDADYLLVTSLATEQSIRTADIVCAAAVLLVNDKLPSRAMKELAQASGITLLATPLPMFEACNSLGSLLMLNRMKNE